LNESSGGETVEADREMGTIHPRRLNSDTKLCSKLLGGIGILTGSLVSLQLFRV
jgi:hypothetical protein